MKQKLNFKEKSYQKSIIEFLEKNNGYVVRNSSEFNKEFAIDSHMFFGFLNGTQSDSMNKLYKFYKDKLETTIINTFNNDVSNSSLIEVLKNGITLSGVHLDLYYKKPATEFNKDLNMKYDMNVLSIMEEVYHKDGERIDLVIFLNGIAIITFELKYNPDNQDYRDAIRQYIRSRDYNTRLMKFKAGALVHFAMDLEEVHMTTHLCGESTYFMPFNKGKGEGIDQGAGNPLNEDGYGVSYMWENILKKDTLLYIISKFVFLDREEKKDENGKIKISENIVFPRFHQLDCLNKVISDVKENHTSFNYLIQHSAGSGKTYTICWLAHQLASLHDENNEQIYDNIIIMTDRLVVDRQLQKKVMSIEHKSGLIEVMDEECHASDLKAALEGNTKIIATTIQKFLYIVDEVRRLKNKKFAVIIDEAHSSTAGKDMAAVTKTLGSDDGDEEKDIIDMYEDDIKSHQKPNNVSMFAFTATPKAKTLALFGRKNEKGQEVAFHLYSMKQAIEEGFILDVLQNYTTYETCFTINKLIEDDPKYKSKLAKKKIFRFAMLHDTNIAQRIEIIIEHFREVVLKESPWAKAMVVTASRPEVVKYYEAFIKYCEEKGYDDIHPLIAFSGKVSDRQLGISDDEVKVRTETSINGFSEKYTADKFDESNYQVLLVANKYQTGFDQAKLSAMYIMKKLKGISAVQTLSRLNRVYPAHDKKIFILDFINTAEEMEDAFKKYYTTTILSNNIKLEIIYEDDLKISGYYIFSMDDVNNANAIFVDDKFSTKEKDEKIRFYIGKAKREFEKLNNKEKKEFYFLLKRFVRNYEFILQITNLNDVDLHKKYLYITWLVPDLYIGEYGTGFDLKGKIEATNFYQKKVKEQKTSNLKSDPIVKIPTAKDFDLTTDEEEELSKIIEEINAQKGKSYNNDVVYSSVMQILNRIKKNPALVASAKNNNIQGFEDSFYSKVNDVFIDELEYNQDFYTMMLNDQKTAKRILGIFLKGLYSELKKV